VSSLPPDKAEKPTQGLVVFYLSLHEKDVMEITGSIQLGTPAIESFRDLFRLRLANEHPIRVASLTRLTLGIAGWECMVL